MRCQWWCYTTRPSAGPSGLDFEAISLCPGNHPRVDDVRMKDATVAPRKAMVAWAPPGPWIRTACSSTLAMVVRGWWKCLFYGFQCGCVSRKRFTVLGRVRGEKERGRGSLGRGRGAVGEG